MLLSVLYNKRKKEESVRVCVTGYLCFWLQCLALGGVSVLSVLGVSKSLHDGAKKIHVKNVKKAASLCTAGFIFLT